ncbi:MAG: hypothetical protein U5L06_08165 [Rhodovibrio sp.]|nr:hypothetical protein [Rhodovibrio sp.]
MRGNTQLSRITGTALTALMIAVPTLAQTAGDHANDHGGEHAKSYGHAGTPGEVDRTVRVEAAGMQFSHDRIGIAPGQTVRFVVTNTGDTEHEFTIGPPRVQRAHRAEMREMMGETHGQDGHHGGDDQHAAEGHHGDDDHHANGGHHGDEAGSGQHGSTESGHDHANSVMVQPGETKELIWHFSHVEEVRFGCNVPGHYESGMHGPFVRRN